MHVPEVPSQLVVLVQVGCVLQSTGATQTQDAAASTLLGAANDAITGIATAEAKPIFFINCLRDCPDMLIPASFSRRE